MNVLILITFLCFGKVFSQDADPCSFENTLQRAEDIVKEGQSNPTDNNWVYKLIAVHDDWNACPSSYNKYPTTAHIERIYIVFSDIIVLKLQRLDKYIHNDKEKIEEGLEDLLKALITGTHNLRDLLKKAIRGCQKYIDININDLIEFIKAHEGDIQQKIKAVIDIICSFKRNHFYFEKASVLFDRISCD